MWENSQIDKGVIFITDEILNYLRYFLDSSEIVYTFCTFFVIILPKHDLTWTCSFELLFLNKLRNMLRI